MDAQQWCADSAQLHFRRAQLQVIMAVCGMKSAQVDKALFGPVDLAVNRHDSDIGLRVQLSVFVFLASVIRAYHQQTHL